MSRKITVCMITSLLFLLLAGCYSIPKEFRLFQKKAEIVQIDRIIMEYPEQGKQATIESVETANPEQTDAILRLLRKIPCRDAAISPNLRPEHECFRITYKDESYQILAHDCNIYYNSDGSFRSNDLCAFDINGFLNTWDKGF